VRERLTTDLKALGVTGCTVAEVRGWGNDTIRASEWEGPSVRFETVVPAEVADGILALLEEKYFRTWSVVAWVYEVGVVRAEKYVGPRKTPFR
jgi:nitrogen regulatory protein P-II 2